MPSKPDPHPGQQPENPAENLVSTEDLGGAPILNRGGDRLGTIHHLMIDRQEGRVVYALVASAAGLASGDRLYPIAWKALAYDRRRGGYVLDPGQSGLSEIPPESHPDRSAWDLIHGEEPSHYYPYLGGIA